MATNTEMQHLLKEFQENCEDVYSNSTYICVQDENICSNSEDNINPSTSHVVTHEDSACADGYKHDKEAGIQGNSSSTSNAFLEKLYTEKCVFKISRRKVRYVRHKVETFVKSVLTKILNSEFYMENTSNIEEGFVYPVLLTTVVSDQSLLKVGSFYEKTKNHFPDEFDFIFVLAECDMVERKLPDNLSSSLTEIFYYCIQRSSKKYIKNSFPEDGSLVLGSYFVRRGPAMKIEVILKNNDPELNNVCVSIDLTPAVRIHLNGALPKRMSTCYPKWIDYILNTGSIVMVKTRHFSYNSGSSLFEDKTEATITESELFVMKNKMSEKHKKVYRLLKYMFNGNQSGSEAAIKLATRGVKNSKHFCGISSSRFMYGISSYSLKLLMFHHMHHCENTGTECLKQCVVDVLDYIVQAVRKTEVPTIFRCRVIDLGWDFSISVQKMTTGQRNVEILDDYRSAIEVADLITGLSDCIKNTDNEAVSGEHKIMDYIPVISKGSDIVQYSLPRINRLNKVYGLAVTCFVILAVIFLVCLITTAALDNKYKDSQVLYCWSGIDDIEGLWNKGSAISDDLQKRKGKQNATLGSNVGTRHERNASKVGKHVFCLSFRSLNAVRGEDAAENVSGLYACSVDTTCNGKQMFQDHEVRNISQRLPQWCDTYAFETDRTLPFLMGSDRTAAVCLHRETCLGISRLTYKDGEMTETKVYSNCSQETGCHRQILTDVHLSSCVMYQSKRQTEMCCCETDSCEKPQPVHVADRIVYMIFAAGVFVFILIVAMLFLVEKIPPRMIRTRYVIFDARTGTEHGR